MKSGLFDMHNSVMLSTNAYRAIYDYRSKSGLNKGDTRVFEKDISAVYEDRRIVDFYIGTEKSRTLYEFSQNLDVFLKGADNPVALQIVANMFGAIPFHLSAIGMNKKQIQFVLSLVAGGAVQVAFKEVSASEHKLQLPYIATATRSGATINVNCSIPQSRQPQNSEEVPVGVNLNDEESGGLDGGDLVDLGYCLLMGAAAGAAVTAAAGGVVGGGVGTVFGGPAGLEAGIAVGTAAGAAIGLIPGAAAGAVHWAVHLSDKVMADPKTGEGDLRNGPSRLPPLKIGFPNFPAPRSPQAPGPIWDGMDPDKP